MSVKFNLTKCPAIFDADKADMFSQFLFLSFSLLIISVNPAISVIFQSLRTLESQ